MTLQLMWVRWRDSQIFVNQYHDLEDKPDYEVCVFESVGFLVASDSDRITLSMDFERTGRRYRQLMSIPTENVVSKKVIPVPSSKK